MPSSGKKDTMLVLRITSEIKELAVRRASEEGRSITNYIERLIVQDARKADRSAQR